MNLYFVRHGESTANVLQEFNNEDDKHPLTEKGVEQACALARSLSGHPSSASIPARFCAPGRQPRSWPMPCASL